MKKFLLIVCTLALMVSLTACGSKFDGSRTGNDSEFIMEYRVLNKTDTQDLIAESGDTISGKIIVNKGRLSIKIQKDDEEPIYENNGISVSDEFDVEINESGTYTVSVTGEKAKGGVSFMVVTNGGNETVTFQATILEIQDGYYLVEPMEGSAELNSADQITIPMTNRTPSPEPEVGDVLEIEYDGSIAESYPAQITNVYSIRVIES